MTKASAATTDDGGANATSAPVATVFYGEDLEDVTTIDADRCRSEWADHGYVKQAPRKCRWSVGIRPRVGRTHPAKASS
jgi:hypothetical protein